MRRFVGKDLAGGTIFARGFEALRVLEVIGMEREGDHGLAGGCGIGGEREEGNAEVAGERVGRDAEDGDVVLRVGGDDGGLEKAGRGVGATDDEVGLAAVAEGLENVSVGKQVALLVDEEGVAEEGVVVAAWGGGFVEAVDDRADGGVGCCGLRGAFCSEQTQDACKGG